MALALSLTLGLLLLVTAFAATFVMFQLWSYPYDRDSKTSAAPSRLKLIYRVLGWVYLILYVAMMIEMVPRLWQYQVELPPRTVVHFILGVTIGVVLVVKTSFLRVFRHLEEWGPALDAILLACTILLSGLSMPFALREVGLASSAVGGGVYSEENRERVSKLLPLAGMPAGAQLDQLSTVPALQAGREVLAGKCVACHDLKTILVQPRTPENWWKTVDRMASKPSFSDPLTDDELYKVTAYLIAISGELQRSVKQKKEKEETRAAVVAEVELDAKTSTGAAGNLPPYDKALAQRTYEAMCSQCHDLKDIEAKPPKDSDEIKDTIIRMIAVNGLDAKREDLDLVFLHMVDRYAGGKILPPKDAPPPAEVSPTPTGVGTGDTGTTPEPTSAPKPGETKPPRTTKARDSEPKIDGEPLYEKFCKSCHAPDGKGTDAMKKKNIPDFTDRAWQGGHGRSKIVAVLNDGVPGTLMKDFKAKLSADEMTAVAAYVKKLK